ncbi:MAG: ATP-NAD kinase family protein [Methanoregulaceae archaeon]|nr:ATP-NAD kinase family protein [Methanoregulaceae archaeon]
MKRIGFLINPVAGMGGPVGLKGTDGKAGEAELRGAVPRSQERAVRTLALLRGPGFFFFTCSGEMGELALRRAGIDHYQVKYRYQGRSSAADTRAACLEFLSCGADLILFCGGDGTARDVFDAVGQRVPILGIPAGVKMFSAVFAVNPEAAADIVRSAGISDFLDAEILDIDEDAYRQGDLQTRLHGYARIPALPELTQYSKQVFEDRDEERARVGIARFIAETIAPGVLYILGPGTTTAALAKYLGLEKTLLGVDLVKDGKVVVTDASEAQIMEILRDSSGSRIIVSPIGAQGFVLGRGNQQISKDVIRTVGTGNIIVIASPGKLAGTPVLHVDTGDPKLDAEFGEHLTVVSGYRIAQRKRVLRISDDRD